MKPNASVLLFALLFLSACAADSQFDRTTRSQLQNVQKDDGISREEAVIIAQNTLLDAGADYDWDINKPEVEAITTPVTGWRVTFPPLESWWSPGRRPQEEVTPEMMLPIAVIIDGATGEAKLVRSGVTIK